MNETILILASASVLASSAWSQDTSKPTLGSQTQQAPLFRGTLTDKGTYRFPLTQRTVRVQKSFDLETGTFESTYTDENGAIVSLSSLRAAEEAARAASPEAKVDPALRDEMAGGAQSSHDVLVWLKFDLEPVDGLRQEVERSLDLETVVPEELEPIEAQIGEFARQLVRANNAPVAERLRDLGATIRLVSGAFPVISIAATPGMVEAISTWSEVDTIYLDGVAED
ncbi:MAG: hypothetical protein AAF368_12675, partial [Planctomycetota bacterium]